MRLSRAGARWIGQVVAWTVILFAAAVLAVAVVIPRLGGATPYTILTGSMTPGMPPGTLVVARPVDPATLAVGDVITYQLTSGDPTVVTHRIVALSVAKDGSRLFRTQGDANDVPDEKWVMPVQVRGRRWYWVPVVGRLNVLLDAREHQWLLDAAVAALGGYALVMFAGAGRDRLRRRSAVERRVGGRRTPVRGSGG
ncbi:signal peptidase I [Nocardioides sp. BP30]|uniref:signal peptidase I n=1 Tax=Nocardioides sp. BP30 TaxID=3036374 RepID=UPI0024690BB2|nr:signal peptidase I [Nocardioides sp. BP30]WGL50407.1 signal peptidase I [Nocardioides sp. BP30]